ncbi:hypothetical protein [Nonomuraea fuscirosea]|uniref:hypothetical protein n=1 Tax=Nonomuraea fuscirosea TaxID=1291556 RepID=UPI000D071F9E|nr:hypothetical protein [Nonomuraea fuscirosea]
MSPGRVSASTVSWASRSTVVTPVSRSGLRSDSTASSSSCPRTWSRPTLLTVHSPSWASAGSQPFLSAASPSGAAALTPHACAGSTDDMSSMT